MSRPPVRSGGRHLDLHTHTVFSDGILTPEQLVQRAVDRGVSVLAITDHDSLEALEPARRAASAVLELVPGIEISTFDEVEMHVLGYFIDPSDEPLRTTLARFGHDRVDRVRAILERLRAVGAPVELEVVMSVAGPGVMGRPHVAEALRRAGHVDSVDDAFRRYLGSNGVAFVPRPRFDARMAISLIREAGGVSVLAHPGGAFDEARLEALVDAGLAGIEIWHPVHGNSAIRRLRAIAARLHLLETGGSDFHAPGRGSDLGDMPVPAAVLSRLKDAAGVSG
jgi:predicted metal-dependent phosphoesterase TrpH